MMRSFKTRNHSSGGIPNTRHEPMENLQRSKKLKSALVYMSKGVAAETNESREVEDLDQKTVENRCSQVNIGSQKDLKDAGRQQSQNNIRAERSTKRMISNETESPGKRNELKGPLDNQKEQRCSSLSHRRTIKSMNKSSRPKVREGSEDIRRATDGSEDEPEDEAIVFESIKASARSEKDNTTLIFESLGLVSPHKSSIVFDSMTKTEKLCQKVTQKAALRESDVKIEDSTSKHEKDEEPGDTYENKDEKKDDNIQKKLFQMLSSYEKKARQIVDDSYNRSSIAVHSQHSVGKEEEKDYMDTVAEKDSLPVHNEIVSFASQPLYLNNEVEDPKDQSKVKVVYPEQGLESTQDAIDHTDVKSIPEKISLPFHDSATRDSFSIPIALDFLNCSRLIGRQQSRPNKQGFELNQYLLKAKYDEGSLKSKEATTNSYHISDTQNIKKTISNESSYLLNKYKSDDGVSTLTSNNRPKNAISPSTTNTIPAEIMMTESNVKVKRHVSIQNGEYDDDRNRVDYAVSSNLVKNRQENDISVITDLEVQNKKNSHGNPIVLCYDEQPVTDQVEFQKMPDNLNLFKMETTNESAPISCLLSIPPSGASFGDQKRNRLVKEVLPKEDIVTDPEVCSDEYQRDTVERQVKKDIPTPKARNIVSSNQTRIASTLEKLMSNIVSSDSKQMNIDNLVLNIDDLVHYLIKEGKLPGNDVSNETSDLQQITLQNNTAELLRNLSILRARRVAALKHNNKKTEAVVDVDRSITSSELSKKFEGVFDPKIRCLDTSLAHTLPSAVLNIDQFSSPMKKKGSGNSGHSAISNIAKIRVRRNEAAMRIKQQTQKLASMRIDSSSFRPDRLQQGNSMHPHLLGSAKNGSDSKLFVSRRFKLPPKPEDACERDDELENLLSSHDWSNFGPKVNTTSRKNESKLPGKVIASCDNISALIKPNSNVSSLLSVPNPYKYGNNSENISVTCPKHHKSLHSGNSEFHSTVYDQLFKPAYTGTSNVRNAPRTNLNQPSVLPSPSDIDMLIWEKVELKKLPLILNPSKTEREREDSKDEYNEYNSNSEVTPTYDTDDNSTLYSDDGDTMGDETLGSASDSARLEHIASMIEILKSRNQR